MPRVRALVTGAHGFVGRHLCQYLADAGDEVVEVDRDDDVTDGARMRELFERVRPNVTYHLAALANVAESWRQPDEYTRVNVVGTRRVLEASASAGPESTTLFVSSAEVYGVTEARDQPLDETQPIAPANPYATSKAEAEAVVREVVRSRGQRVITVRPFNHLGPGQSPHYVVPALVQRLLLAREEGRDEISVGDLSTQRDFTDVRDVVRAYRLVATRGVTGETYHVASGRATALAEIARELVATVAPGTRLVLDRELVRPIDVPISSGRIDKINRDTQWRPVIPLTTSLRDVVDYEVARLHQG